MTPDPKPKRTSKAKRKREEFARKYGSKARVQWMSERECVGCGKFPHEDEPTQSSHIYSGGTGFKEDYTKTVPHCMNCNQNVTRFRRTDLERHAARTQARWLANCAANGLDPETGERLTNDSRRPLR